jgi:hypothetical protein
MIGPNPGPCEVFLTIDEFLRWGNFCTLPKPKLEDHPFSAARHCLFNILAATLYIRRLFVFPKPEEAPCCDGRKPMTLRVW